MVKTGWNFILPLSVMGAVFLWQSQACCHVPLLFLGWTSLALAAFCINFFRDPQRQIPKDADLVISPADGKVIAIETVEDPYVGQATEIRVFLNVFNVHVQRSPFTVAATVEGTRYFGGKFLAASVPKASLENEQHWIRMRSVDGAPVVVKQIAGLIARRIVPWVRPGDVIQGGQHVGLIQFGSQVDLVIPRSWDLKVGIGDKVAGGETIFATRPLKSGRRKPVHKGPKA
jgi:phosphatidylserine decarboxylase